MSIAVSESLANQDRRLLLQPPQPSDQRRIRTLLDLLTIEKTDGLDPPAMRRGVSRWKILRERLGLNSIGCCGVATWRYGDSNSSFGEENDVVEVAAEVEETRQQQNMNLAAALEAERQFRAGESRGSGVDAGETTPSRVSLMRLLDEGSDGGDLERGDDRMCCVCMGREKGAALIPCGHTYCRECSREVWRNRGSCPLCNHHILDILHIF